MPEPLFNKVAGLRSGPLFNKIAGLRPALYLKEALAKVLFCKFCEISKNTFSKEHLQTTASVMIMSKQCPKVTKVPRTKKKRN